MQMNLLSKEELRYVKSWSHGGSKIKLRRKIKRPLVANLPIHVVFKSSKARGSLSFYKHKQLVARLLQQRAKKYFVEVKQFVNMGNHLHLCVKFKNRELFQNFLRTFAALLARKITGASRAKGFGRFWDGLVFTRVLHSSLEVLGLKGYFEGNHRQRELGPQERQQYLAGFNSFLKSLKSVRAKNREFAEFVLKLE
jgi:REP element-mobilizing transposase RayT